MKKYLVFLSLFVMMFLLTTHLILDVRTESVKAVTNISSTRQQGLSTGELAVLTTTENAKAVTNISSTRQQGLSTGELALLTGVSALSPGISLLRVAYHAQEKGANFPWIVLLFLWLLAAADCAIDKIPVLASFHHFLVHGIILGIAYLGSTYLGGEPSMWIGAVAGSAVQVVRQVYTIPTDTTVVGAPVRSLIEDIVAFLMLPLS